jgi:hypothetical protein
MTGLAFHLQQHIVFARIYVGVILSSLCGLDSYGTIHCGTSNNQHVTITDLQPAISVSIQATIEQVTKMPIQKLWPPQCVTHI